jgi:tetratricopeptide (TPR) repeat protein
VHYKDALDIQLKHLGPLHPDVAMSYNNLGNVYRLKGDYNTAIEYIENALNVPLDQDHLQVAISKNHLGNVYQSKG